MPIYPDTETFYAVMADLFGRVLAEPGLLKPLTDGRIVLQMTVSDPAAVLVVDGRSVPPHFTTSAAVAKPDIGLRLAAATLHAIWSSQVRLRDALGAGAVKLDSSPLRALSLVSSLTPMFRFIERIYPQIVANHIKTKE